MRTKKTTPRPAQVSLETLALALAGGPDEIRDEVRRRLLELNAQRAKEEALAGATAGAIATSLSCDLSR